MDWVDFFFILIVFSWALTGMWRWYAVGKGMLDHPNARSSHKVPTPRGGGMIFTLGWFVFLGLGYWQEWFFIEEIDHFLPALIVVFIGIYEDIKGSPRWVRFACHTVAAILFLILLGESGQTLEMYLPWQLPWWAYLLGTVFVCVWFTNLFNFMDGTDGFATMQALIIFGMGGMALWHAHSPAFAIMAWSLCGLLLGFLVWNWPIAKIFMGDSGSATLGLLVCMFTLVSFKCCQISPFYWLILSSPFWYDATVTLLRRILAKDKWGQPHKLHAYQRMIQIGWSHQKLLVGSLFVNMGCVAMAYYGLGYNKRWPLMLAMDLVYLTVIYLIIEIRKPMYKNWYKN